MTKPIQGFSKLSKAEKINWIANTFTTSPEEARKVLGQYWNSDTKLQQLHDEFAENTLSNFYVPFGVAPNFLINGKMYAIPMAVEESSVVAAASNAAKYWLSRGGFKAQVLGMEKVGQVHFTCKAPSKTIRKFFEEVKPKLLDSIEVLTRNMRKRGGGLRELELRDKTHLLDSYYQLHCTFDTVDAMGANFINSCLEHLAETLEEEALHSDEMKGYPVDIIMSILSNYVPNCLVRAEVRCPIEQLTENDPLTPAEFAEKMNRAIEVANIEPYRAVTHNKGVMNGIDAVVLATGNDYRAVEAGVHAFAAKDGEYTSLTHAKISNGEYIQWIELPLALGTVGGLTSLHPLVKLALQILQKPSAAELMEIVAVAGLAQNFAAMRSLVTTGIQQGHMKMHLMNILNQLGATEEEKDDIVDHFKTHTVTYSAVAETLAEIRAK